MTGYKKLPHRSFQYDESNIDKKLCNFIKKYHDKDGKLTIMFCEEGDDVLPDVALVDCSFDMIPKIVCLVAKNEDSYVDMIYYNEFTHQYICLIPDKGSFGRSVGFYVYDEASDSLIPKISNECMTVDAIKKCCVEQHGDIGNVIFDFSKAYAEGDTDAIKSVRDSSDNAFVVEYADLFLSNEKHVDNARPLLRKKNRTKIPLSLRQHILRRDNFTCQLCGAKGPGAGGEAELQIDHKLPLAFGGETIEENLWTLCWECNQGKKDNYIDL